MDQSVEAISSSWLLRIYLNLKPDTVKINVQADVATRYFNPARSHPTPAVYISRIPDGSCKGY